MNFDVFFILKFSTEKCDVFVACHCQRGDAPAPLLGIVNGGEGIGIAHGPESETEREGGAAHGPLTGAVPGKENDLMIK